MGGVERGGDLRDQLGGEPRIEVAALGDQLGHVDALDVAHDDEQLTVLGLAGAVERDDVGVLDLGGDLGLAAEALAEVLVGGQLGGDHLDGDRALEPQVGRAVHDAHAAAAGRRVDAVAADDQSRPPGRPSGLLAAGRAGRRHLYSNGTCTVPWVPSLRTTVTGTVWPSMPFTASQ